MIKFLHTADWHLGIKYKKFGPNAEKAREIRIKTAKKLMEIAKENKMNFVIIAGDLFDNNDVSRKLIDTAIEVVEMAVPVPVYILPGNHDPLTRDSLYMDQSWDSVENAIILKKQEPINIPEINTTLYPCPVTQKQTKEDLTEWIKARDKSISIGIAHGNLQIMDEQPNFPIDPQRVEKSGLDYLAIGEWHSLYKHAGKDKVVRTVYPGTPEVTKSGEQGSGKAVIVEIETHGSEPIIQEIDVGTIIWEEKERQISTVNEIREVERELDKIESPECRAIDLCFKGVVDQEVVDYIDSFEARYSKRFLYFNLRRDIDLRLNLSKFKEILPEGAIFYKTVEAIQALAKHPTQETKEILKEIKEIKSARDASPKVVERALLQLYQMLKEVTK